MSTRATIERLESLIAIAPQQQTLVGSLRSEIVELDLLLARVSPTTRARIELLTTMIASARTVPPGTVNASGAPLTKKWLCVAVGAVSINATGAPHFKRWLCVAVGHVAINATGAPLTKRWTCAAFGQIGINATGAPLTKRWTCVAVGQITIHATGAPLTKRWTCTASGQITVRATGAPSTKKWTCVASGTVIPIFDPATLSLTGWWRANYPGKVAMDAGTHWVGTASAGSSGAHDLTKTAAGANSPHDGTLVNGLLPAHFLGTTNADRLAEPTSNAVLFAAAAGSAWFLIFPDAAAAHTATPYQNGNLLTDGGNAETDFCYTTSGAGLVILSGGVYKELTVACAIGAWHLLQFKWDGTNMKVRVDSGAWNSQACGNWDQTAPGAMQLGFSFADVRRFDGSLLELGTSNTVISDANFDNIKSYVNARYSLAL